MTKKKPKADIERDKLNAEMQERGKAAFVAYYQDGPYVRAKLAAGMLFTPELVTYLEREVDNRKIADEIRKEAVESDNGNAKAPADRAGNGVIGTGTGGSDSAPDAGGTADAAGPGGTEANET